MIKNFFSLAVSLMVGSLAYCQDTLPKATISLNTGLNHFIKKDAFQSPYSYKGINPMAQAIFSKRTTGGQYEIALMYSPGRIKSIVSPKAHNQFFELKYNYLFRIDPKRAFGKFEFYLGPEIRGFYNSTNYLPDIAMPVSYQTSSANLMLHGKTLFKLNKESSVVFQAAVSAIGFVYRPDFEINGERHSEVSLLGRNNVVLFDLSYERKLGKRWGAQIKYNYSYFSYEKPRPVTILENGMQIGVRYLIK